VNEVWIKRQPHVIAPASRAAERQHWKNGGAQAHPVVLIVERDCPAARGLDQALAAEGIAVKVYEPGAALLTQYPSCPEACLLVDVQSGDTSAINLLSRMRELNARLPIIAITAPADVRTAVQAMRAGALDCIECPVDRRALLASLEGAWAWSREWTRASIRRQGITAGLATLTPRQRQIMDLVLAGQPSKNIAADLGISQRTVESHRAAIMKKTGTKSLPALTRLVLAAAATFEHARVPNAASSSSRNSYAHGGFCRAWNSEPVNPTLTISDSYGLTLASA
jgi:two-component system CheB/CheR fusion protein